MEKKNYKKIKHIGEISFDNDEFKSRLFTPAGVKFMLFSDNKKEGYLRLQSDYDCLKHSGIVDGFELELKKNKIKFSDFNIRGGGKIIEDDEKTIYDEEKGYTKIHLIFGDESASHGRFDESLLEQTLKNHFKDELFSYEIKKGYLG